MGPIATAASRINWDAFCTLTFSSNGLRETVEGGPHWARRRLLLQWVRNIEMAFGIPDGFLIFLAREERGEKGGHFHWHVLVCGLHHVAGRGVVPSPNPTSDAHRLANLWKQCRNGGRVEIREYDAQLSGVSYVLKGLENLEWSYAGANAYELGKFAEEEDRELILAPHFLVTVERMSRRNRRHRTARDVKKRLRDRSDLGSLSQVQKPASLRHDYDTSPAPKPKKRRRDWSWRPGRSVIPGSAQA